MGNQHDRPADKRRTHFERPGSLRPPGVVGRLVRLVLGILVLWALYTLITDRTGFMRSTDVPGQATFWIGVILAFHVTPYVVNIGWGRRWHRKPQIIVGAALIVSIVVDLLLYGSWWAPPLGTTIWLWLSYITAHLGASLVLAAILRTPGCEMRAIPQLWARLGGRTAPEHYCPGPLDGIDRWEARRRRA